MEDNYLSECINNPQDALKLIVGICLDYDGCRTPDSLIKLIDEIKAIALTGLKEDNKKNQKLN